jgi:hypothetical protein
MATTFHAAALAEDASSGTALASATVAVTAGDGVLVWCKYEGAVDTGTNVTFNQSVTLTGSGSNKANSNNDLNGRWFYAKASASGTIVATMNTPGSRPFRAVHCYTFTPTSGQELVFDVASAGGEGNGAVLAISGGTMSVAGSGCAVGGFAYYSSISTTAGSGWTVGLGGATTSCASEYRILSASGSIDCNATENVGAVWAAIGLAMKEQTAAAPAATTVIVNMMGF